MYADPSRTPDPQLLVNMAAIQYHRGPDGFGYRLSEGHGVGFSHARLSIIDLDENRARQPFTSADGRLLLLDAHAMEWRTIRLARDPGCAVCAGASRG